MFPLLRSRKGCREVHTAALPAAFVFAGVVDRPGVLFPLGEFCSCFTPHEGGRVGPEPLLAEVGGFSDTGGHPALLGRRSDSMPPGGPELAPLTGGCRPGGTEFGFPPRLFERGGGGGRICWLAASPGGPLEPNCEFSRRVISRSSSSPKSPPIRVGSPTIMTSPGGPRALS